MAPFRVMFPLALVLLTVLVAGCTLLQSTGNGTSIEIKNITTIPTIPSNESCPIQKNTTPWITIHPIGDHYLGDVIEINGTTNCDEGEILIGISDANFHLCPRNSAGSDSPCPCCDGVLITAPIITGICGNNSWSSEVNTSQHHFYPGEFYLEAIDQGCGADDPYFEYFNNKA